MGVDGFWGYRYVGSSSANPEVRRGRFRVATVGCGTAVVTALVARLALVALGRDSAVGAGVLDAVIFAGAGIGCVLSAVRAPAPRRRYAGLVAAACLFVLAVSALVPLV